jgi:hypothetical protein
LVEFVLSIHGTSNIPPLLLIKLLQLRLVQILTLTMQPTVQGRRTAVPAVEPSAPPQLLLALGELLQPQQQNLETPHSRSRLQLMD